MSGLVFVAVHASVLLAVALTAYVAGATLSRLLLPPGERAGAGGAAVAIALGLLALATLGWILGIAGRLARGPWIVVVAAIHAAGLATWRDLARRVAARSALARGGLAVLVAAPFFTLALYPPTAFDETLYHLPFARAFVASGALPFLPELRFPVFPQLGEVLSAEVLALAGDVATHLVALLAILATAGLLAAWGRRWSDAERPEAGWLAAALWLGHPLVAYLGGTGYVEPLLALFVTAAAFAFWNWRRSGAGGWLALAGALAGAAAGTKYLGLFFVAASALATILAPAPPSARPRRARRLADFALVVGAAGLAMAPWYGRLLFYTGNPVFPYLSGLFGANAWTPVHFFSLAPPGAAGGGFASTLLRGASELATLPFDVFARRARVGGMPPISPAFLLGIPLLVAAAWRDRGARAALLVACGFLLFFPALPADARYLVTVLPLFALVLGVALAAAARNVPPLRGRRALVALALLIASPGWLYAGYRVARQGPPPCDAPAREAYLSRRLPFYPAVARVNALARPGAIVYGFHLESARDFVHATFLGDFYGPRRYRLLEDRLPYPPAFLDLLREWRVDFLMVARDAPTAALAEREAAGLERVFEDSAVVVYALRRERGGA